MDDWIDVVNPSAARVVELAFAVLHRPGYGSTPSANCGHVGPLASRLYTGFVREHRCTDPAELDATWAAVQADLRGPAPLHAVLLADYEWGAQLIGNAHHPAPADEPAALRLLMFRRMARLSAEAVSAWLAAQDDGAPAGTLGLTPSVDDAAFDAAIAAHPRGDCRRRDLPGQLHLPPRRPGLGRAPGAVPPPARAPAGALRRR
jgi:hypothetical protein